MHGIAEFNGEAYSRHTAQPVYIEGIFAWLHRPQAGWDGDTAVLICSALNRDALDSHRYLRVLADEFAGSFYPTLRFDYPGTGDSCDVDDFPAAGGNAWLAWQQSVQIAADYLLAETGAKRLIICGLRIGAMLATIFAEKRTDVAGLVLLAPVIRGQSYIRQLWVEAGLQQGQTGKLQDGFDFQELKFSDDAVRSIAAVDLRAVEMPAGRHIAICAQSPSAPLTACQNSWAQQGADIWSTDFTGLDPLLTHDQCTIPAVDFTALMDWTRQNMPVYPTPLPKAAPAPNARLHRNGLVETPVRFGPLEGLFGMLCQPESGEPDIAVILCTSGRDSRHGAGRSAVHLAHRLARAGIASLRIDFAGLGDSAAPPGYEFMTTEPFENRLPDIKGALDRLIALGYRRFAVQGVCSGAFHAFQAALADPRIGMLFLVNMPHFEPSDEAGRVLARHAAFSWRHYLHLLMDKEHLRRLLAGRYSVTAFLKGRMSRFKAKAARLLRPGAEQAPANYARSAVARLSQQGVRTLFLFGREDKGFFALDADFGPGGAELVKQKNMALQLIEKFDHSMAQSGSQQAVSDAMLRMLRSWGPRRSVAAAPMNFNPVPATRAPLAIP